MTALLAALMTLRRRHPDAVALAAIGTGLGQLLAGIPLGPAGVGYLVLARWAACWGSPQVSRATLAGALAVGPLTVWHGVTGGGLGYLSAGQRAALAATSALPFVLCWAWGRWARARRAELMALEARAAAAGTDLVRAGIAREMYDVITHDLTAMTVQAGSAGYVLPARPHQARDTVRGLGSLGRQVLAELDGLKRLLSP
ncbi:histidine kinase [Kitasatospora sp. NPDC059646]|uniref:histidine kinase n=1 Tax=Kitasatospora sp. NPDC059646 TaxID=3346893 RepID=UPI0036954450